MSAHQRGIQTSPVVIPRGGAATELGSQRTQARKVKLKRHRAATALPRVRQGLSVINYQDLQGKAF